MKLPEKMKEGLRTFWQGASFVLGGLLLLDFLVCLIAAFAALGWLMEQVELVVFTAALLLLGILFYLPRKSMGVAKLPRRLLGAGLIGGGLVLVFFIIMYVAMFFFTLDYIRHIKVDDAG